MSNSEALFDEKIVNNVAKFNVIIFVDNFVDLYDQLPWKYSILQYILVVEVCY